MQKIKPRPYLDSLATPRKQEIRALLEEKAQWLWSNKKGVLRYRNLCQDVHDLHTEYFDFSDDVVRIGRAEELTEESQQRLNTTLRGFMPWRKGPFNIFGIDIDAEWRSERKWQRVLPFMPDLKNKIVADIGCNNGYYMFRMAYHQPHWVIGFEPYLQHYFTFQTLKSFIHCENLAIELLGVEHIGLFKASFDVVFLMGILYHRTSPLDVLKEIRKAMKPGGILIVESQAIAGESPIALFPESRYAKVPGTYFVPTAPCLINWLKRAGFAEIKNFCFHPMSSNEQRRTDWMVFESFQDFIDSNNPDLTVEGYPAPHRVYIRAVKQ